MIPVATKAERQPKLLIIFIRMGAEIATPNGPPMETSEIPIPRFSLGSHLEAAVIAKE